jgi:hypothetical protein
MAPQTHLHLHLAPLRHAMHPGTGHAAPHTLTQLIVVLVLLAAAAGVVWVILQVRKTPPTPKPQ